MYLRKFVFLLFFIFSFGCSTSTKLMKTDLKEDSEFLKGGAKIEEYKEIEPPKVLAKKENQPVVKKKKPVAVSKKPVKAKKKPKIKVVEGEKKTDFPFKVGERVVLSANYFGVEAGKITIGMNPDKKVNGKLAFNFYAEGKTSSVFSMFYRIHDKVESLWDPVKKRPFLVAFHLDESKQKREIRTHFDWGKKKASFLEEGKKKKKGKIRKSAEYPLNRTVQDIVSAFFYFRSLPLQVGKYYSFHVFNKGERVKVTLKVSKREVVKTSKGPFEALLLKPEFQVEGKFKKVGDISLWVTDDEYRQIVRIETKIKIGTVVAKLHSIRR